MVVDEKATKAARKAHAAGVKRLVEAIYGEHFSARSLSRLAAAQRIKNRQDGDGRARRHARAKNKAARAARRRNRG